jgi:DNA repair exonuclease SbcCD ATPase subunit
MDRDQEKRKIKEQLATCRRLASEFTDGVTAQNLKQYAADLEVRLEELGRAEQAREVVQEQIDDQRATAEKLRRKMD